ALRRPDVCGVRRVATTHSAGSLAHNPISAIFGLAVRAQYCRYDYHLSGIEVSQGVVFAISQRRALVKLAADDWPILPQAFASERVGILGEEKFLASFGADGVLTVVPPSSCWSLSRALQNFPASLAKSFRPAD